MRWDFSDKGLGELPDEEYVAILETLYNVDVKDEFRQEFSIERGGKYFLFGIFGAIVAVSLILFACSKIYRLHKRRSLSSKGDWKRRERKKLLRKRARRIKTIDRNEKGFRKFVKRRSRK